MSYSFVFDAVSGICGSVINMSIMVIRRVFMGKNVILGVLKTSLLITLINIFIV